uniref:Short-chain dehydrogenase n=1 Tax=Anisakis simplex TaxID=6269 RepID=A0A0M3K3A3_ANISI
LPILEPKYVVDNIMEAVLTNKPFMALPKTCYFLMFLASFMPAKTADLMRDLFGVSHTMKNFKGRTNKTE